MIIQFLNSQIQCSPVKYFLYLFHFFFHRQYKQHQRNKKQNKKQKNNHNYKMKIIQKYTTLVFLKVCCDFLLIINNSLINILLSGIRQIWELCFTWWQLSFELIWLILVMTWEGAGFNRLYPLSVMALIVQAVVARCIML